MRFGRTIRNQFLLSLLVVLAIPVILLGILSPLFYAKTVEDLTASASADMIGQVNRHLDQLFLEWEQLMTLTAQVPPVADFLAGHPEAETEVRGYLGALRSSHPEVTGMAILNGDGQARLLDFTPVTRDPLLGETWARQALASPATMHILARPTGRNLLSRRTMGDNVVSLIKAFPPGVVLMDVHLKTIEKVFGTVLPGSLGFLYLVDPTGDVVYAPVNPVVYRIPPAALTGHRPPGSFQINGRVYQVFAVPSAYTGLSTVAVYDLDAVLEGVRLLGWVAVLIGLTSAGLAIAVAFWVSSGIAKPIVRLRRLMEEAEEGNLEVRYPAPPDDEVGRLGRSFNTMIGEIAKLVEQVYQEQQKKREAEFRILQAQIKPHFLYNTLDTIHWMAHDKGADDIVGIVDALTRLFRISLSKGRDRISLGEELEHVTSYLVIQKIRYAGKLDYVLDVDPGLEEVPVVKLTLQPLVENAIYHGIKEKAGPGRLRIEGRREGDALVLTVADDGVGMEPAVLDRLVRNLQVGEDPETPGFGVFSVHHRIRLAFGEDWGLSFESEPGVGTRVRVRQPVDPEGGKP
jgi:two-component system sensor histidine kinase YesM